MWPEITGYKGTDVQEGLPTAFVDQLVQVQLPDDKSASGKATAQFMESSSVAEADDILSSVTESHAVAVAIGDDGKASASGTLRLYMLLALLLAVVGIIIGVVL